MRRAVVVFAILLYNIRIYSQPSQHLPFHVFESITDFPNVGNIFFDSDKNMWLAAGEGITKYTGYIRQELTIKDGLPSDLIFGCFEDSKHRIWFKNFSGEASFFFGGKVFNSSNSKLCKALSFNSMVINIEEYENTLVFTSKTDGIKVLKKNKVYSVETGVVQSTFSNHKGGIYIVGYRGIYSLSLGNYKLDTINKDKWSRSYVTARSVSPKKTYFTYGSKVFKLNNGAPQLLAQLESEKFEIISNALYNDSILLLGTRQGLAICNLKSGKTSHMNYKNSVPAICVRGKEIWFSVFKYGICKVKSLAELRVKIYPIESCFSVMKAKDGSMWMGGFAKVVKVNEDGSSKEFVFSKNAKGSDYVTDIIESEDGFIYVLGKGFLSVLKNETILTTYPFGGNQLLLDSSGNILYVRSVYLNRYKLKAGFIKNAEHVYGKTFSSIVKRQNQLFGSSGKELYRFYLDSFYPMHSFPDRIAKITDKHVLLKNGTLYSWDKGNAITKHVSSQFLKSSFHDVYENGNTTYLLDKHSAYLVEKNRKGYQLKKAVNCPNILKLIRNKKSLSVFSSGASYTIPLTSILDYEKDHQPTFDFSTAIAGESTLSVSNPLNLNYKQRAFRLNYKIVGYLSQPEIYFRIDQGKWTKTSNLYLDLNLSPGKHMVYFYYGLENLPNAKDASKLSISIKQPLWMKNWFKWLVAIFLLGFSFLIYSFLIARVKKRFKEKENQEKMRFAKLKLEKEAVELEQLALRMQMNPHFIFNALNTIKGFYADGEFKEASEYIGTFTRLLRTVLENDKSIHPLSDEVNLVKNYLEMSKVKNPDLTFKTHLNIKENPNYMGIPCMILQPFVENAILHGFGPKNGVGHIDIYVTQNINRLTIRVVDNGIGIRKTKSKHASKSMEVTYKRLEIFNAPEKFTLELREKAEGGCDLIIITKFKLLKNEKDSGNS